LDFFSSLCEILLELKIANLSENAERSEIDVVTTQKPALLALLEQWEMRCRAAIVMFLAASLKFQVENNCNNKWTTNKRERYKYILYICVSE
jgi:hypothetical protein